MNDIPRPEYPRPQFVRCDWLNLNGEWTCRFDPGKSGLERGWNQSTGFETAIQVPFCPESKLSGLAHADFIEMMWYHREITIPAEWHDKLIILHFGGVDYECEVYLNGEAVGVHTGGVSAFSIDLTKHIAVGGKYQLVVLVKDEMRSGNQPLGKQAPMFKTAGCRYSRTTGIWQTVWLEAVNPYGLRQCRITPDFDNNTFVFTPFYYQVKSGCRLNIRVLAEGKEVAAAAVPCSDGIPISLSIPQATAWEPGNPFLYDVVYEIYDGMEKRIDRVESYAGLRKIHIEGDRMYLNNQPFFMRFVLDQGFYEDGLWTAPCDAELKRDIELAMACGFNGARLHQKIFEERFHYWADRLGYLTWAEFPDWGLSFWGRFKCRTPDYFQAMRNYMSEWANVVLRDVNHPSIVAWTPSNETVYYVDLAEHRRIVGDIYDLTRALDPTRPVNDSSGYIHVKTDLWTVHHYSQDHLELSQALQPTETPVYALQPDVELPAYTGQPYIIAEYGGVKYIPTGSKAFADNSWGYGKAPVDAEEAFSRIRDLTLALVAIPSLGGYCYTQLTDIEQEQNGIFNYNRTPKFDTSAVHAVFSAKPDWSKY